MDNLLDQGREMLNSLVDQRNVIKVLKDDMNHVKCSLFIVMFMQRSLLVAFNIFKFIIGISTENA